MTRVHSYRVYFSLQTFLQTRHKSCERFYGPPGIYRVRGLGTIMIIFSHQKNGNSNKQTETTDRPIQNQHLGFLKLHYFPIFLMQKNWQQKATNPNRYFRQDRFYIFCALEMQKHQSVGGFFPKRVRIFTYSCSVTF